MKKIINTLIAFIFLLPVYAQFTSNPTKWHSGALVLRSGLEMNGEVAYEPVAEIVQFRNAGIVKAFTSHQVQSFRFIEEKFGMLREFAAYDVQIGSRPVSKTFFEVVLKGPLMVVRRINNPWELEPSALERQNQVVVADFDYQNNFIYYVYHEGQFVNMKRFKKAVLPLMHEYKQELSQYVRKKDMTPRSNIAHQIRLINEYNFLKSNSAVSKLL